MIMKMVIMMYVDGMFNDTLCMAKDRVIGLR